MKCVSHRFFFLIWSSITACAVIPMHTLRADSFDWRNVNGGNWNSPVENQNGGTCWVFSGVGLFEARYKLTRNDPVFSFDCSEQQVEWDCGPSQWGGWGDGSVFYSVTHGLVSATECPIDPNSNYWNAPGPTSLWPLATGWQNRMLVGANTTVITSTTPNTIEGAGQIVTTTQNIKAMLKMYGPMMTAVLSTNDLYNSPTDIVTNYRAPMAGVDHAVVVEGYQDDASIPTGGYWIIKNSWGATAGDGTGYYDVPYGDLELHGDIVAINTAVYYTGAMATVTWKGTTNSTWNTNSNTSHNWSNGGANYTWVNQETQANFTTAAATNRRAITISSTAIAHGLNFSTTGYSIAGGSLTVTNGGIVTSENVTISSNVYVGVRNPGAWRPGRLSASAGRCTRSSAI